MPLQSRFLSIFVRRDSETKRTQRDEAASVERHSKSHKHRSRAELSDWEVKYGAGAGAGATSSGGAAAMEKGRLGGSASTFISRDIVQPHSVEFLPKLELGFGAVGHLAYAPLPTSSGGSKGDARGVNRPVLATIQPGHGVNREWDSYVASRTLAVASPQPLAASKRHSRTVSLFSLSRRANSTSSVGVRPTGIARVAVPEEEADDDDVPLALAAARSLSTGALPRSSTMYDLSSSSAPNLIGGDGAPPRSRSRMSLAVPAVLASPPPPSARTPTQAPSRPGMLPRSSTLIDLNAPSTFDPYHAGARQAKHSAEPERIAVGERRRRAQSGPALDGGKTGRTGGGGGRGARIMEFGELEEKHRKRLSMLQGTANDKVSTSAALARFQAQQRAEAESQRQREARRSVNSGLYLVARDVGTGTGAGGRRSSMGSLAALLKSPRPTPAAKLVQTELNYASPPRARRASTQVLVRPSSGPTPLVTRPSAQRRHSLGTLLEVVPDACACACACACESAYEGASAPAEKVAAWRRGQTHTAALAGRGEAALPQRTAERAPPPTASASAVKKKHDWLSY